MEQMDIGATGLRVARMGFGGIPIQRVDEETAVSTVFHAVESGVDFIDTARLYTTSERRIGLALKQTGKKVVLASKSKGRTAGDIRRDIEQSLEDLQTGYIDLYQCHFVGTVGEYEKIVSEGGALEGMEKAVAEGLIGHIGVTSHSLDVLDRVIDDGLFETVMACFSFLEPEARENIIPKALSKKIGVIAMKSFSGGAIDNPELALKWALSHPDILLIPGVENKELFDANWGIFKRGDYSLTQDEKREIEKIRGFYSKNFCRRCDYCQPCTEEIPIQLILGVKFVVKRFGKSVAKEERFQEFVEKAKSCSECGECLARCPYELPIPDLIRENLRWLDKELG